MGLDMMLTTTTAAAQLGVSPSAILRYYHSGILRGERHGRYVLVEQRSVLALMAVIKWAREGKKVPPGRGKGKTPASPQADEPAAVSDSQLSEAG